MTGVFVYGTLCHPPLLATVLGRAAEMRPARLADHAVRWAEGEAFPLILPAPGETAEGALLPGLGPDDLARLDFYEAGFGYATRTATVTTADGPAEALVYWPAAGRWTPGAPWRLTDWAARWSALTVAAAEDFMRGFGRRPAAAMAARYPQILIRAASRLRAAAELRPATLRRASAPGDVAVEGWREPYAAFFSVEEADLRFRRFDGAMSAPVTRAAFVSGDAVTVLPYDPARDRVLLVEQFRMGAHARGDPSPWLLEAVAGRIDPGETPEAAARREAAEEAGLALGRLFYVARYYPSPGAKTEYLYSYVGLAELPDAAAGLGGLVGEGEDIRAHVLGFDRFMALIDSGEADNGPLILTGWWLARHRARLRALSAAPGAGA